MEKTEYAQMFQTEETMWWYKGLREVVRTTLKDFVKPKALILDAGCGNGKTIEFLESHGYRLDGIDNSEDALYYCKVRGIDHVKKADITNIPYQESTFDAVICLDVLGILAETALVQKAVNEFHRILKKNGILIIQCAAYEWLRSQHDTVTHIKKRFTKSELESFFTSPHWKIVKSSYRVSFLFLPIMVIKLFKKLTQTKDRPHISDQYIPPSGMNTLLTAIQGLENKILQRVSLPFGSSILLVAQKI